MKVVTYLINLDGSEQRLVSATAQLNQAGWDFTRFSACDGRGKALSEFENYDDNKAKKIMGRSLLSSELGCYLSHYGCVEKFLETDADYLVVLEDDIKLTTNFSRTLNEILDFLENQKTMSWYLINIGAKKRKLYRVLKRLEGHELLKAYYFPIRTMGLVWSRKGAENFLNEGRIMYLPIDNFLQVWLSNNAQGLSIWPPMVYPSGFESEIDKNRSNKNKKEMKMLAYNYKRQMRTWNCRLKAIKNIML